MTIAISKEDIFLITEVMNSRDEDGIDGYLERKTGKVLTGIPPIQTPKHSTIYLPQPSNKVDSASPTTATDF